MTGKGDDIKKKLEVNPKTKIPQILFTIYQHVFNSIYMLSSNLNTPYPPPDLLHPMAEKIQILSANQAAAEKTEVAPVAPVNTPAATQPAPAPQPASAPVQPTASPAPPATTPAPAASEAPAQPVAEKEATK